jgi:site-specific recombinase XerD
VFENPPGSGVWWINFYSDGKRHREKVGRRSDAIDLYRKRKVDARAGVKLPPSMRAKRRVLFRELAQDGLKFAEAHKRTIRQDRSYWATMEPVFGDIAVDDMKPSLINEYFVSRKDAKPATINRYRSFLSMCFQEAIRNGKAEKNPARLVRLRREDNARIRFLTFEEEATIRRVIRERTPTHEGAFIFAIETGMRKSEQHSMEWSQVSFERRQVILDRTKNGSSRVVVMSDEALAAVREAHRRKNKETNRVWLSRYDVPLDSPDAWFKEVKKHFVQEDLGLKSITWHVLRHTFISRLVMAGVDLRTVQELAGHKDIKMTIRYAHLAPEHKLNAVQMLSSFRAKQTS